MPPVVRASSLDVGGAAKAGMSHAAPKFANPLAFALAGGGDRVALAQIERSLWLSLTSDEAMELEKTDNERRTVRPSPPCECLPSAL